MTIDREYLEKQLASIIEERDKMVAIAEHQASSYNGAIALITKQLQDLVEDDTENISTPVSDSTNLTNQKKAPRKA